MEERSTEKMLGEVLFTWNGWDEIETGTLQFYDVEFPYESMRQYNGCTVSKTDNGQLEIFNEEQDEPIWEGIVLDIPEFREKVLSRYK